MSKHLSKGLLVWLGSLTLGLSPAQGQTVITEIMYNPASTEGGGKAREDGTKSITRAEWVEIYNPGSTTINIAGWTLRDNQGSTTALAEGSTLEPGQVAVIAPDTLTVDEFGAGWGGEYKLFLVGQWGSGGLRNLANNPKNGEYVQLCDAQGNLVDGVRYENGGDWPRTKIGSIYLVAGQLDAQSNDVPQNWKASVDSVDAARTVTITEIFDGPDVGSPGVVPTETPAETAGDDGM